MHVLQRAAVSPCPHPTPQVKCLVGCIFHNFGNRNVNNYVKTSATCVKSETQYDYSSLSISWM